MRIGNYTCPDVSLSESIKDAKNIYDRFKDEEVGNLRLVSETIGYRGGTFLQRIAALRKYGLVTLRGKVKVTELGKTITYPAEREVELNAREKAIDHVELFKVIYAKFGLELPKEKFWVNLTNITGAEAPDAQAKEDVIRQVYMDSVKSLIFKEKGEAKSHETPTVVEADFDFATFETEDFRIQIRKDLATIEFAKTKLMEVVKPWLEYVESKIKEKEDVKNV